MSGPADSVVEEIRDLVSADGGEVEVVHADDTTLHLALVLPDDACRECVLPRSMLELVAADLAGKHGASGLRVTIDDPREP